MRMAEASELFDDSSIPSPDGTMMAYRKGSFLWVHDFTKQEDKEIVDIQDRATTLWACWSPDSKRIAYAVWNIQADKSKSRSEIKVMTLSDGKVDSLLASGQNEIGIIPTDWSKDGKHLLFLRTDTSGASGVWEYSFVDRSVRNVSRYYRDDFNPTDRMTPKLSPDGNNFVSVKRKSGLYCIALFGAKDSAYSLLTDSLRHSHSPVWTQDGRAIVFLSKREDNDDLMMIPVKNNAPLGEPILLKSSVGVNAKLLGLSDDGRLYYACANRWQSIYTLSVDPTTGRTTSQPVRLHEHGLNETQPYWSSTGLSIFHFEFIRIAAPDGRQIPRKILVQSFDKQRHVEQVNLHSYVPYIFIVSPDSDYVFFDGWNPSNQRGLFALSIKTQEILTIVNDSQIHCSNKPMRITGWDRKEKRLLFECPLRSQSDSIMQVALYSIDLKERRPQLLTMCAGSQSALSPNNDEVVYVNNRKRSVEVKSLLNDRVRTLVHYPDSTPYALDWPSWSHDGKRVLFARFTGQRHSSIMSVSATGGEEITVLAGTKEYPKLWSPRWSPRGDKIAFTVFLGTKFDIWEMKNFLPRE